MNSPIDRSTCALDGLPLFLEEQPPYADPTTTGIKRILIAAFRLMPEIADEFARTLGVASGTVTQRISRLQRARERFPALVTLLTQDVNVTRDELRVPSWVTSSLISNAKVMHSNIRVFADRIQELGFADVPLAWGLFPCSKGLEVEPAANSLHHHFLMVGAQWSADPVYEEGSGDHYDYSPGPVSDALLYAENAMTKLIWHALERSAR